MSFFESPIASRSAWVLASSSHWPKEVPSSNGTQRLGSATKKRRPRAAQVELAHHQLVEQADDVGAGADHEALVGEGALQRAGAAEPLAALEHEHAAPGPGQVGGGGEAVVAAADDDRVPLARGELAERLRQPQLAELLGDRVHATTSSRRPSR